VNYSKSGVLVKIKKSSSNASNNMGTLRPVQEFASSFIWLISLICLAYHLIKENNIDILGQSQTTKAQTKDEVV